MGKATGRSRGFTLIASLLLLVLLSAIAVGLIYTVTGAGHVGGNDMEANTAYYGAESGMEKLTADVGTLYQQKLSPSQNDLDAMAVKSPPSAGEINGMTFKDRATWTVTDPDNSQYAKTSTTVIASGQNQGLTAEIIPITLQVTATRPSGASVNMTRSVQVALIPVFQFGVFSDSDLSYFPGPPFAFAGRVHTNGNLFLASDGNQLYLGSKVTAVGEIIRDRLANNFRNGASYQGSVYVPNATGACDSIIALVATGGGGAPGPNCLDFGVDAKNAENDASWSGGIPPAGAANPNWAGAGGSQFSTGKFNSMIGNAKSTGVQPMQLPFVSGADVCPLKPLLCNSRQQIQILRPPPVGEDPASPLGGSREYKIATIRILLADTEAELHPDGTSLDPYDPGSPGPGPNGNDVPLDYFSVTSVPGTPAGKTSYVAVADQVQSGNDPGLVPAICDGHIPPTSTNCPAGTGPGNYRWPLVKGWLRVEYLDSNTDAWIGVTKEWLSYGFAKSPYVTRTAPGIDAGAHPDAILIFQELADRDDNGAVTNGAVAYQPGGQVCVAWDKRGRCTLYQPPPAVPEGTENNVVWGQDWNFYPINFYDVRQGTTRDNNDGSCYVNGVMNAVELDVGNLNQWLLGKGPGNVYAGGSGTKVNYLNQNGYLLYFSDRRGMLPDPKDGNVVNGESGWEDVINSATGGTPDGVLEPITPGYNNSNGYSPEDVDENGQLDFWGARNMGDGFGIDTFSPAPNPYKQIACGIVGETVPGARQNWVSGAHHVLRLVDGSLGNLPIRPDSLPNKPKGGFTVVSENPVYVWGDYNSSASGAATPDPFWTNPTANPNPNPASHAEAAIIADAVTLLSNGWSDKTDWENPTNYNARNATVTYYRMAIAAGKNMNFPQTGPRQDFGTDGGLHNFLRYLEDWGGVKSNYRGSLISLYYSEYDTSIFKITTVYNPPNRNYFFDTDFLIPTNLPPGTPKLLDINNLTYWQSFSPCPTQVNGSCTD